MKHRYISNSFSNYLMAMFILIRAYSTSFNQSIQVLFSHTLMANSWTNLGLVPTSFCEYIILLFNMFSHQMWKRKGGFCQCFERIRTGLTCLEMICTSLKWMEFSSLRSSDQKWICLSSVSSHLVFYLIINLMATIYIRFYIKLTFVIYCYVT